MNVFQPIEIQTREQALAPIAARLAAFKAHEASLLNILRNERSHHSGSFDEGKSWSDLCEFAEFYFRGEDLNKSTMSGAERSMRLRQLARALRRARSLTDQALKDDVGNVLYRAVGAERGIGPHSVLTIDDDVLPRLIDEIKEMATTLTILEKAAHAAVDLDKRSREHSRGGRPTLFPKQYIQVLARLYRSSTGSRPGRGNGPFANFASAFFVAAGQTGFSRSSLIDAIQDAHRHFKPSWFDGKPPHF